ncbi:MAG: NAD(P)-dependent oxidoreductase [Ignavibacteria bacterium]|nr:NAD(P)-dependent oxidoreductase [Ignavibacteria bacterium]
MKVLITGGSGLLGQYLNRFLSKKHNILSLYFNNPENCIGYNSKKVDITNYQQLSEIFTFFKPNIVIHTAAYSKPEVAEKLNYDLVYKTNVVATKFLVELCNKFHAKIIFTSTDLVYDGFQGQMLSEDSKINPLSIYARTKLLAEEKIKELSENYIILRTSLLYGLALNNTFNHFTKVFNDLKEGKKVKLFYDQYRTPLSLINAVEIIEDLLIKDVNTEVLNFGGLERVSRLELGQMLCDVVGFDKSLIEKISMDDFPELVKVPDVSLNTKKLQSYTSLQKTILESIKEIIKYG